MNMKATKKEVEDSVLFFAKIYGKESNYKAMMKYGSTLPRIIEMIAYEMFLQKFCHYKCNDEEDGNYCILFEYATELKENGWVEFN